MVIAAVVGGVAAAGATAYSAHKASQTNNKAINAQQDAAGRQADLAEEQWAYNRDVYMPHATQLADENAAMQKRVSDQLLDDSAHNRQLADESTAQAKKSWKYQDEYMKMTDDYVNGNAANTQADEANADVEQAYGGQMGQLSRNAARYGIDMGSGAMAGAMGDMYSNKTLAAAGAQTNARRMARDKAEQMVGIAAGSGQAGFGTGLTAAGLATGAAAGASGASGAGLAGENSTNNSINYGYNGAGNNFGGAASSYKGSTGVVDPFTSYASGLLNSGIKAGAANNWFGGGGSGGGTPPPYSGAGGGDGGFGGTFDAYGQGIYPD